MGAQERVYEVLRELTIFCEGYCRRYDAIEFAVDRVAKEEGLNTGQKRDLYWEVVRGGHKADQRLIELGFRRNVDPEEEQMANFGNVMGLIPREIISEARDAGLLDSNPNTTGIVQLTEKGIKKQRLWEYAGKP